jgi:purine-nucleoside phosphorylase
MLRQIQEATTHLKQQGITSPEIGVILGTGQGNVVVQKIIDPIIIRYNSNSHFPEATDDGNPNNLNHHSFLKILEIAGKAEAKLTDLFVTLIEKIK